MGNQPPNGAGAGNSQQSGSTRPASAVGGASQRPQQSSQQQQSSDVHYSSTQANGTGTLTQARKPAGTPVILNIYEPSQPQQSMPGFGIYHTGIEFSGVEYSFAGGPDAGSGTGVMSQQPRATPAGGQWKYKQSIELGTVSVGYQEFERTLNELRDAFPANTYDLIHRNCNHFTTAVAKRLGLSAKYPSWVNRAASWGAMFTQKPANVAELPPPKESVFKSTTGYRLDGSVASQPKGGASAAAASSSSSAAAPAKKEEAKKQDKDDKKKASAPRKNPWADPNFVPPGMRNDPVVAGAVKAQQQ